MSRRGVKLPNYKAREYIDTQKIATQQDQLFGKKVRLGDDTISKIVNPIAGQSLLSATVVADAINTRGHELKTAAGNLAGLIAGQSAISGDILSAAQKAHLKQDLLYLGTRIYPKVESGDLHFSNAELEHLSKMGGIFEWANPGGAGLPDVIDYKTFDERKVDVVVYLINANRIDLLDELKSLNMGDELNLKDGVITRGPGGLMPPLAPPTPPKPSPSALVPATPLPVSGTYPYAVSQFIATLERNDKSAASSISERKLLAITDPEDQKTVLDLIGDVNQLTSDLEAVPKNQRMNARTGQRSSPQLRVEIKDKLSEVYKQIKAMY